MYIQLFLEEDEVIKSDKQEQSTNLLGLSFLLISLHNLLFVYEFNLVIIKI